MIRINQREGWTRFVKTSSVTTMTTRTTYLASAICTTLADTGACDINELLAQLEDRYDGSTSRVEVERELHALEMAGSVESWDEDGVRWYRDAV
jgi:hypothetical protein